MTLVLNGTSTSASAPAVVGDTANTGVYYPATNQVAIATNGTLGLIQDANQNIGIGLAPSAWGSQYSVVQTKNGASFCGYNSKYTLVQQNFYSTGAADIYLNNGYASQYYQVDGSHVFRAAASGTAGASIASWTQVAAVSLNNTLALQGASSSAGTGIAFPATQSASSDANTLDDYEEGGWTPAFGGNGTAGSATYSIQSGKYTKIGRVVVAMFDVQSTSALSGSSGVLCVRNLPFAAASTVGTLEIGAGSTGYFAGYTGGAYTMNSYVDGGQTNVIITYGNNGSATNYGSTGAIANGTRIQGSVTYITS